MTKTAFNPVLSEKTLLRYFSFVALYFAQGVSYGLFIFYGYGLGLLLKLSGTAALGLGLLFFVLQIVFSKWWFSKYRFGPLEWLWRSGTNGKWQTMSILKE